MSDNNIVKIDKKNLEKSALGRLVEKRLNKIIGQQQGGNLIILDVSGSMNEFVEIDKRKIDILEETVNDLDKSKCEFITFSDDAVYGINMSVKGGFTNLAGAFKLAKGRVVCGIKNIIVITDGLPDNEGSALSEARGLIMMGATISYIYCGKPPIPKFLLGLGKECKGVVEFVDMGQRQLGNKIAGLLKSG